MKKYLSVIGLSVLLSGSLYAQTSIITGAAIEFDGKNFESAITEINKALQKNDGLKPKDLAKAYVIRGKSYLELLRKSQQDKSLLQKYPDMALNAYDDFANSAKNDEKGSFKEQMKIYKPLLAQALLIRSNELISKHELSKAWEVAEKSEKTYSEIGNDFYTVHIIKGSIKLANQTNKDSLAAITCLEQSITSFDKNVAAMPAGKQRDDMAKDPAMPQVYATLVTLYGRTKNDVTKSLDIATKGKDKYPNDENIKRAELDIYLMPGLFDKALIKFEEETKKNPNDIVAHLAYAGLLEKKAEALGDKGAPDAEIMATMSKAMEVYKGVLARDLSKDPKNASLANFNMGALQNNIALRTHTKMEAAPDDQYEKLKEEKKKYLLEAMKYMEKAYAIDAKNLGVVNALVTISANLMAYDPAIYKAKVDEFKKKQKELGGGD